METNEKYKQTIKELVSIAKNNNFYLCPISVWDTTTSTIEALRSENIRLKVINDKLRKTIKECHEAVKNS